MQTYIIYMNMYNEMRIIDNSLTMGVYRSATRNL